MIAIQHGGPRPQLEHFRWRAWELPAVAHLTADDIAELERIEALSPDELDAELRADGVDLDRFDEKARRFLDDFFAKRLHAGRGTDEPR